MKKISILIPCYNEEENVGPISQAVVETMTRELPEYDYELVFIDNDSTDQTRPILRELCRQNPRIKAIFNAKNFGQFNSPYYGLLQVTGDCVISMVADFQDPVELIPQYVREWEKGYKIVIGIKTGSKENPVMYWLRSCYYKMIKKLSDVEQIEHFTGSGLYDREFIEVLRRLDDPTPFLRGIVAELGYKRKEIPYVQPQRRAGKTHNNFYRLYDAAMLSITSYTKVGLRLATIFGSICAGISIAVAFVYLILKLLHWNDFPAGMAPVLIGMCFLGSVQIFFIGLVGEYILSINARVMKRPLVVENNSQDPETFASYEKLQKEFPNVRVVKWEREFNYSAINNFGVTFAKGEYLLFLNNDTEPIEPRFIEEMLGLCQRDDVGVVGARLLYQDDTIQHAGVVVGFGGIAGHTFIGLHKAENSYFHRAMSTQDYSAVTAACMMSKKSLFEEVGGFTEELAVAFNDIDYCMKVRAAGKLVVYNPYALLYHYESKSRGLEDTPEKIARFNREIRIFSERWPKILEEGDPYYNPNLTLRKSNFALRDLKKEAIGEPYKLEI